MAYMKVLAGIAFLGSIGWFVADPGFEPALAIVGSLSALISIYVVEKREAKPADQYQNISSASVGVQAGRDLILGPTGRDKDAE